MARGKLDQIDWIVSPLFFLGLLAQRGFIGTDGWPIVGDLSETLITIGNTDVSIAIGLMLAAFGILIATNDWSFSDDDGNIAMGLGVQGFAVIATLGLIIAPPFSPIVADLVSSDAGSVVAFVVQTSGYAVVSWLG